MKQLLPLPVYTSISVIHKDGLLYYIVHLQIVVLYYIEVVAVKTDYSVNITICSVIVSSVHVHTRSIIEL